MDSGKQIGANISSRRLEPAVIERRGSRVVQVYVNFCRHPMKRFVISLLTTWVASTLIPRLAGMEQGRQNAMQRLADRPGTTAQTEVRRTRETNPAAIARLVDDINAAVRADKQRALSVITINTNVAATTLEQQKTRTGLTFGDIYVAHSLALSTRKKFDSIIALKKKGQTWSQIARAHNVALMGSKELLEEMKRR